MRRRRMATMLVGVMTLPGLLAIVSGSAASASSRASASAPPGRGASSVSLALITASGSTWAANAVDKWISNTSPQGIQVVYTATGSASGRQDFALHTTDFGLSDIGYQGFDPVTGTNDTSSRPYAYLPVTAGGTSFPYNLIVGGHRVINLRLSGLTLAKIFTNHITNWDDPAIKNDNNGRQLPSLPITTVVPSEGSGTTAQFTRYLNKLFPSLWVPFNGGQKGFTEYWPRQGSSQVAQSGSTQIMNYIQSPAANGSIGVDEYSYALAAQFPVIQLENTAGYYVLPSEYNDAVALTQAQINYDPKSPNYLLENLDNVYTYNDPRTYPLSSYSYTVMPVSKNDPRMAVSGNAFPAKWQTLADFLYYSICRGQDYIGPIGYSALPVNLVEAGFKQIDRIKQAAPKVNIAQQNVTTCHNPTFIAGHPNQNYLAQIAPQPPLCDKTGHGPCSGTLCANCNGGRGGSSPSASPTSSASGTPTPGASGLPGVGPGSLPGTGGVPPPGASPSAVPIVLAAGQTGLSHVALAILAVLLLLAVLVAPPLLVRRWSARAGRQP